MFLNISRDSDTITPLGSLCQCHHHSFWEGMFPNIQHKLNQDKFKAIPLALLSHPQLKEMCPFIAVYCPSRTEDISPISPSDVWRFLVCSYSMSPQPVLLSISAYTARVWGHMPPTAEQHVSDHAILKQISSTTQKTIKN